MILKIGAIIVNYRTADLAITSAKAIQEMSSPQVYIRTVVVDGGSGDGSAEAIALGIAELPNTELLALPVNGGFAFANNCAMQLICRSGARPEALALINPDARVREGALEAMAAVLSAHPDVGAVGGRLEHEDGREQGCAFPFPSWRSEFCRGASTGLFNRLLGVPPSTVTLERAGPVPWVTGAAVMFRTSALEQAGLFDDGFFLYFEETELMQRLRRCGWDIWHEPAARIVHHGGVATQIRDPETGMPFKRRTAPYWYEARRRYFTLCHGPCTAFACGLAFLAGRAIWKARTLIRPKPDTAAVRAGRDLLRFGLLPRRQDRRAEINRLTDRPKAQAAWMARQL